MCRGLLHEIHEESLLGFVIIDHVFGMPLHPDQAGIIGFDCLNNIAFPSHNAKGFPEPSQAWWW